MALGLKGGFALAESGLTAEVSLTLARALVLAGVVPALGDMVLRRILNGFDAAAIAATCGSVSAVTFITAVQMLDSRGLPHRGPMAAAMALMESPAIVMAVLLAKLVRQTQAEAAHRAGAGMPALGGASAGGATPMPLRKLLHESLTVGAQLLRLGAMALAASASYVAVPAVIRQAIPEANASLYFGMCTSACRWG